MAIKYKVVKYFDTYPDGEVFSSFDEDEAKKECTDMNKKVSHLPHTKYVVRPEKV